MKIRESPITSLIIGDSLVTFYFTSSKYSTRLE